MQIRIHKDGEQRGPYSSEEVVRLIKDGIFHTADLGWSTRLKKWVPLSDLLSSAPTTSFASAAQPGHLDLPEMLALGGSLLIFLGAFTPVVSEPLVGGINFLKAGWPAYLTLLFAVASMVVVFARIKKMLWVTGGLLTLDLVGCLIGFFVQINSMSSDVGTKMGNSGNHQLDELGKSLGNAFVESIQLQWGCFILGLGAFLILVAAFLFDKRDSY